MKKHIIYLWMLATMTTLAGCFSDDSTPLGDAVSDITVSGIAAEYTKTAFVGEHLTINPSVETGYSDSDMTYQWLLLNDKTGKVTADGDTIQPSVIATTRNLDYEVSIAPGEYQIRFVAKSLSNGYTVFETTRLSVQTNFSQGFYILKETAEGNTDVDLYGKDEVLVSDLFKSVNGAALKGKPRQLSIVYNKYYINPDNDEMEGTNGIFVTTADNHSVLCRTSDMQSIFDSGNLWFESSNPDEQVYGMVLTYMNGHMLLTSKGIYYAGSAGGWGSPNSGKFGMPVSKLGTSTHFTYDPASYGGVFVWDETNHNLTTLDYNGEARPLAYSDMTGEELTQNLTGFDCLACGYNHLSSAKTAVFILVDNVTGKRYVYTTESGFTGMYLKTRRELPAGSHMSQASAYAVNGISGQYVYCVDKGSVFAYLFGSEEQNEVVVNPDGISSGETVVYVGNLFWSGKNSSNPKFDYFTVATQSGDRYKVYMYETVGGIPQGKPVKIIEGHGKFRSIRYMGASLDSYDWGFGYHIFNVNN